MTEFITKFQDGCPSLAKIAHLEPVVNGEITHLHMRLGADGAALTGVRVPVDNGVLKSPEMVFEEACGAILEKAPTFRETLVGHGHFAILRAGNDIARVGRRGIGTTVLWNTAGKNAYIEWQKVNDHTNLVAGKGITTVEFPDHISDEPVVLVGYVGPKVSFDAGDTGVIVALKEKMGGTLVSLVDAGINVFWRRILT